jgi:hypothetical protein
MNMVSDAGFINERQVRLTGGITSIYTAIKPQAQ